MAGFGGSRPHKRKKTRRGGGSYSRYGSSGKGLGDTGTRSYASGLAGSGGSASATLRDFVTFINNAGERIAKGSFQAVGLSAQSMGYGGRSIATGQGITGGVVTGDTGLTGYQFLAKYQQAGISLLGEKVYELRGGASGNIYRPSAQLAEVLKQIVAQDVKRAKRMEHARATIKAYQANAQVAPVIGVQDIMPKHTSTPESIKNTKQAGSIGGKMTSTRGRGNRRYPPWLMRMLKGAGTELGRPPKATGDSKLPIGLALITLKVLL